MDNIADKNIEDMKLTDLIETAVLQKMQDEFSEMVCMAALITDENGTPITVGSNFSRFCTDFCRKSPKGKKRCEQCDKMGAVTALEQRLPVHYYCHANLVDFAAPIMLDGRMIGSFIGGQVLPDKPDLAMMRKIAKEIEVDEEEFIKAAKETAIVPMDAIARATKFIYGYAEVLSEMAYKTYVAKKMSEEALQAATAKTDFLANMSHEIRTPLNAIIGMAQIAMREEMSDTARKCMKQITSSGNILLAIVNDILDYSKMESGKMSIVEAEYQTLALIRDVAFIISNRVGDKNIELILDVDPSIPCMLYGDDIRLKQIMINLANNAVKFTNKGFVALRIGYSWRGTDEILIKCKVEDTGIGIKKEAFAKLFDSFEQVDTKRNRNIEGTGLGLAIVKNLVELMGGNLSVESEYEKGSTFSFEIPQKVIDKTVCVSPLDDCPCVIGLVSNPYLKNELAHDIMRIGAQYVEADSENDIEKLLKQTDAQFMFVSEDLLSENLMRLAGEHTGLTTVRIVGHGREDREEISEIKNIRKPLYSINVASLLRNLDVKISDSEEEEEITFTAPDARILIVDDNKVNLTVATGLLEPLCMQMDTAISGKQAIEKISNTLYDLILMDHMMPEMDGVETTRIIRRLYPEYDNIPIIALSANAVRGTHEMFLSEGMNDFVAKPIDLKILIEKLKKYLPMEKLRAFDKSSAKEFLAEEIPVIPGLDTEYALKLLGSVKLFYKVLKDYYRVIDSNLERIKQYETQENWRDYCTQVHALKSASRQIGASYLADKAGMLELASAKEDAEYVHNLTDDLLADYRRVKEIIAPYCEEEKTANLRPISLDLLRGFLENLYAALNNLDLGVLEKIYGEMKKYSYKDADEERFKHLGTALDEIDTETAGAIVNEWLALM